MARLFLPLFNCAKLLHTQILFFLSFILSLSFFLSFFLSLSFLNKQPPPFFIHLQPTPLPNFLTI